MLHRHTRRTGLLVAVVIALLGTLTVPAVGQVADLKTFTVDIDGTGGAWPAVYAGDADAPIAITITNTSANQSLGSANVTVPAPFALVTAAADTVPGGPVIELRSLGLAPGQSATLPITVHVRTCAPTAAPTFAIEAKQSNDFAGQGNDFSQDPNAPSDLVVGVTGVCALAFDRHPGDAERGVTITSVDYAASGPPITVEVRDAGNTGRATHATPEITLDAAHSTIDEPLLTGTTSSTAVAGLAEFSPGPNLTPSGSSYVLDASGRAEDGTTELGTGTSEPFDIVDVHVNCDAGAACDPAESQRDGQTVRAEFGSGQQDTTLVVSLGAGDVPAFTCAGYTPGGEHAAQFDFVGDGGTDRSGTVTLVVPNARRPLHTYEVCWAAPYEFEMDGGGRTLPHETLVKPGTENPLHVGLLPDCAKRGDPARPCVSQRSFDRRTAAATIVVQTTGEDPWARS